MASFEGAIEHDPDRIVASAHPEEYVDDFVAIGEFQGKEAVHAFFDELFAAMPDRTMLRLFNLKTLLQRRFRRPPRSA